MMTHTQYSRLKNEEYEDSNIKTNPILNSFSDFYNLYNLVRDDWCKTWSKVWKILTIDLKFFYENKFSIL